jgi:hypothetical protein
VNAPDELDTVLTDFDRRADPFDEFAVRAAIIEVRERLAPQCSPEQNAAMWADLLAFALSPRERDNPWGTFFGPMGYWQKEDGTNHYSPDIAGTEPAAVNHWMERAQSLTHPVLRARYADVAWDMARAIGNSRPEPAMAQTAIDAYLDSISRRPDPHGRFMVAIRALDLSVLLADDIRIDRARQQLLALHRAAVDGKQPHWWHAPDRLLGDARTRTTDAERDQIIADLEAVAALRSNAADPGVFDPHATEAAVKRLVKVYRRVGRHDDARRNLERLGKTFEHFASLAGPMLASSALQVATNAYRESGNRDDVKRTRKAMEASIEKSQDEMVRIPIEIPVSREDRERYLKAIVADDIGSTFVKLAVAFLDRREQLAEQVAEQSKDAPLQASLDQQLHHGRQIAAVIGAAAEDPEGRLMLAARQGMMFSEGFLIAAFARAVETLAIEPDHFVSWVARHGMFKDLSLVREGVVAWFEFDFVKAIHVLVPQIEHALRGIADELGLPVTKASPVAPEVSVGINMGDMLYARPELTAALGEDLTLHFRALYADPRGFNLRNYLAHGMMEAQEMTFGAATRVMHSLLILGAWKEISESRNRPAQNQGEELPGTANGE